MKTLPDSWFAVSENEAAGFEAELKKEVCPLHPLHGLRASCLARRKDRDDFLFSFPCSTPSLAVVHLTWSVEKTSDYLGPPSLRATLTSLRTGDAHSSKRRSSRHSQRSPSVLLRS